MSYRDSLELASFLAAISTAVVATLAYGQYQLGRFRKRWRLERYLKAEKGTSHTLLHLVAQLGMTETELVEAAFRSKVIRRKVRADQYGLAGVLLLSYEENSN